jgi:histidine ammonia-lyase
MEVVRVLDGESLTVDTLYQIGCMGEKVALSKKSLKRMGEFRKRLETKISKKESIYGVNTGFGMLSNTHISERDARKLQTNLVRSHSAGVGPPFPEEIVREAMTVKLNSLLKGNSCVRPEVATTLAEFLNRRIVPFIPQIGSLGASGDLAPSAYMALAMIGEGRSFYKGTLMETKPALREAGIAPLTLDSKEGISLINGTCFTAALACQAVVLGRKLLDMANSCVSLTGEVLRANMQSFDEELMQLRGQLGQVLVARDIRTKLQGSKHVRDTPVPQDPYSIRCSPQVHGSVYDAVSFAQALVNTELNAVTDNPVMNEAGVILHGGNFHAQPVAMALDLLSLALSYLGDLSLARIHQLMRYSEGKRAFFASKPGLESGLMLTEYTATALMNENSTLIHPSSSYPANVSGGVEDHASHGVNAGLKALKVSENVAKILSIELLCSSNALSSSDLAGLSSHSVSLLKTVRSVSHPISGDRPLGNDIEALASRLMKP